MDIVLFSMIAMRMTGLIFLNPLLGRRNFPNNLKAGMVLVFTFLVYSTIEEPELSYEFSSSFLYGFLLFKEFLVGYVLGYVMELFFFVITHAGSIIDFHMGLSMSMVYDPQTNAQIAMTGNIFQIFYVLLFFAVDGHLVLIRTLLTSGELVPYGQVAFTQELAMAVLEIFRGCIVLAVRFAFPIIAIELLVEVAVGIMMKVAPQVNIFVINIQVKIAVGFLTLLILISPMKSWLESLMHQMLETMGEILTLL
ncbi:MAG: flagellar biosynthetic protein FliR [Lachnospiraceae bacterium]|jgi:flagellar biosynthetic protein FliR|nr:flagellar biosynthetic protein FliR [Lachnospiraceae bacterium]